MVAGLVCDLPKKYDLPVRSKSAGRSHTNPASINVLLLKNILNLKPVCYYRTFIQNNIISR